MLNDDFYPTPPALTGRMMAKTKDQGAIRSILEPSAGRGDMVDYVLGAWPSWHGKPNIDTIEIEPDLRAILRDKGRPPVADDFLTFTSFKRYDLIMMNPPFSEGAKHLHKALDLIRDGGQVICLLNAETIRNAYTNERRDLVRRLEDMAAEIEYIADAFKDAPRSTSVEVALVSVAVAKKPTSDILTNLVEARQQEIENGERSANEIVDGDYIKGAIQRYEVEAAAGVKLINEYEALKPILTREFSSDSPVSGNTIIELKVLGSSIDLANIFIEQLRNKYWSQLFQSKEFANLFTSGSRELYRKQIGDLVRYEFNVANIKQMQADISTAMLGNLDQAIIQLFDEFSNQYYDESSKNIHYYNGWKTNKAHRIDRKVVTRLNGFSNYDGGYCPHDYRVVEYITDLEKVFGYLDGKLAPMADDVLARLRAAHGEEETKGIDFEYCTVDFFKKGTAHITFTREDLLKKFNLIGSQSKGWLPPAYGTKSYEKMNIDEREAVDNFEGQDSYRETFARNEFYLGRPTLQLEAGTL